MKSNFLKFFRKPISFLIFFISLTIYQKDLLNADEKYLDEMEINSTTKLEESSILPTNPFEIVEMIRRANSMNDATKPSDAIDDALKSFNMIEEKENSNLVDHSTISKSKYD